jgi:hypothetical protein
MKPVVMKLGLCGWLVVVLATGCVDETVDDLATSEVESAATIGQGTRYQGTRYQGTRYQGTRYQGTRYQGTRYQGALYGNTAVSNAAVTGSTLVAWTPKGKNWEQRFPDKICTWNSTRTVQKSCTNINLATTPSPLAGMRFPSTFVIDNADGTKTTVEGYVQVGMSSSALGVVSKDTSTAMHPLTNTANTCTIIPKGPTCDHPNGCRVNCDLWLYDIRLDQTDPTTGALASQCPSGELSLALAGSWADNGTFGNDGASKVTFACTGGTIAKCARWGYRPFGSAVTSGGVMTALGGYHQACIRAATADYCANGHSFTFDGTLVDFYDHDPSDGETGFVPRTRGNLIPDFDGTAFVWESSFDPHGAVHIDHTRYQELAGTSYGHISDPAPVGCPGRYYPSSDDALTTFNRCQTQGQNLACTAPVGEGGPVAWSFPRVHVDSTPACAHGELTGGKWLNEGCSQCTNRVTYADWTSTGGYPYAYCTDPAGPGWDANCVAKAQAVCPAAELMTSHSECTAGAALGIYESGCALKVCLGDPSCCNGSWSSTCVAAANTQCTGGKEGFELVWNPILNRFTARPIGFCGT